VPRPQLHLSRGWSQKSKFLIVSKLTAVEVFKCIRASVETDILPLSMQGPVGGVEAPGLGGDDIGPAATAGAASTVARQQWEQGEEFDDLAPAPGVKQQVFRN